MNFVKVRNISMVDTKVEFTEVFNNKPEDGKYLTRLHILILSSSPVLSLYVDAGADTVESLELIPITEGNDNPFRQNRGSQMGLAWAVRLPAFGKFQIDIISKRPEVFNLEYRID